MPRYRSAGRRKRRSPRRKTRRRCNLRRLLPARKTRTRWRRVYRALPGSIQIIVACVVVTALWFALNGLYQVARKPSELFFPVSDVLHKTPVQTWRTYGRLFERHSTATIAPEFLAALAQTESAGNPIVRTYWRWSWRAEPFDVYRPASSAVGMYQITNGTFAEARRYCVRSHVVIEDGPWNDWRSCWFNALYTRTLPSHAIEMTSAYLDRRVNRILARHRIGSATLRQKQQLAAIVHLCGAGAGSAHARRGLDIAAGQHCGDHDVKRYVTKVAAMQREFERLRADSATL